MYNNSLTVYKLLSWPKKTLPQFDLIEKNSINITKSNVYTALHIHLVVGLFIVKCYGNVNETVINRLAPRSRMHYAFDFKIFPQRVKRENNTKKNTKAWNKNVVVGCDPTSVRARHPPLPPPIFRP